MSSLAVRPGRNAAREAKRLKEVRKVKGAIEWNVKEREKRQKLFRERWESKQSLAQRKKWELDNITKVRTTALKNAREDWLLGPLRPNRAIGVAGEKYGALTGEQVQKPEIPVHTWKHRNDVRIKRGLEPEYPLVVDDKKYFHIAKDDRVVVIRGREKGKIGVVQSTLARTHQVFITDINTVCSRSCSSHTQLTGPAILRRECLQQRCYRHPHAQERGPHRYRRRSPGRPV
jgi:large subunit ribosomal protein L24